MSDTNNTIGVNIVIPTGKTQQDMESLTKTINKYQEALEKALRYNTPITINGIQHTREEVQGLQNDLITLRDLQKQSRIDVSNKEANKQALAEIKEQQKAAADKAKEEKKAADEKIANEKAYQKALDKEIDIADSRQRQKEQNIDKEYKNKQKNDDSWVNRQLSNLETVDKAKERQELAEKARQEKLSRTQWYDGSVKGDQIEFRGNQRDSLSGYYNRGQGTARASASAIEAELKKLDEISSARERTNVKAWNDFYNRDNKSAKDSAATFEAEMKKAEMATMPFRQQLSLLKDEQQSLWKQMQGPGVETSKLDGLKKSYADVTNEIKKTEAQQRVFNKTINDSGGYLGSFQQKLRSHTNWILAGSMIAGAVAVPAEIINNLRETESLTLKIKQNLELAPKYHGNETGLNSDLKNLQNVASTFAMGYGVSLKETMEMMQVLSRRFKSPEELTYYTNLAMTMHKLDFVEPKKAAEDLEATILSMGLNFEQSKRFIDEFSVAVHVARITGTELLTGLQRSAATFHNMNFNTAEAIAMISTLSTVTAKAGANVGASLNSILINVDFKKASQALKAYSIEVYDASGKMRDGVEIWRDIAKVFNGLDDQKANEFANAMSGGKFRANDLRAILANWQTFEKILDDINTKASPGNTAQLLQTGLESFDTKLKQLTASLTVFGIVTSENTLPALKGIVVGLTEGVQWLNKNKEAVNDVIEVTKVIIELLLVYKARQLLANSALGGFWTNMIKVWKDSGGFIGSIRAMGGAFLGLARTIGKSILLLAAFKAASRVISGADADTDEKTFLASIDGKEELTPGEQDAKDAIDKRNAFIDENALVNGDNDFTGKWALYTNGDDQEQSSKLDAAVRDKVGKVNGMASIDEMVKQATEALEAKGIANPPPPPGVEGQNIGGDGKSPYGSSGGSDGPSSPSDSERRKRIQNHSELKQITEEMKASADRYAESLDNINTKESLYGKTVESTTERFELLRKRMSEMATEQENLANLKAKYQSQIDEYIAKDQEFQSNASEAIANWDSMSKSDKRDYLVKNKEDMQEFKTLYQMINFVSELNTKIAEAHKNANKLTNEFDKDLFGDNLDVTKKSQKKLEDIGLDERIQKAGIDERKPLYTTKTNEVELAATRQRIAAYEEEATRLQGQASAAETARQAQIAQTQELINSLKDQVDKTKELIAAQEKLNNLVTIGTKDTVDNAKETKKNAAILAEEKKKEADLAKYASDQMKKTIADSWIDMAQNGASLRDIWKKLFNDFQKDAIYALLGIKNQSNSIFSNLLGGKAGGGKGGKGGVQGPSMANGSFYKNSGGKGGIGGKHATGGVVNVPSIAGEDGEEVIIPTEKNTQNSNALLDYASSKLGSNGTSQYVPYFKNQSLNSSPIINVEAQQNEALVEELKANNAMMKQQNHLLLNGDFGGGGGVSVISTQMSDEQIMAAIKRNPGAFQNIMGNNKNKGWR